MRRRGIFPETRKRNLHRSLFQQVGLFKCCISTRLPARISEQIKNVSRLHDIHFTILVSEYPETVAHKLQIVLDKGAATHLQLLVTYEMLYCRTLSCVNKGVWHPLFS